MKNNYTAYVSPIRRRRAIMEGTVKTTGQPGVCIQALTDVSAVAPALRDMHGAAKRIVIEPTLHLAKDRRQERGEEHSVRPDGQRSFGVMETDTVARSLRALAGAATLPHPPSADGDHPKGGEAIAPVAAQSFPQNSIDREGRPFSRDATLQESKNRPCVRCWTDGQLLQAPGNGIADALESWLVDGKRSRFSRRT